MTKNIKTTVVHKSDYSNYAKKAAEFHGAMQDSLSKGKMHGQLPYWYSIAIHGAPDPKNIGKSNSGGCIHLDDSVLRKLIEDGIITIGTKVIISDRKP